MLCNNWFNSFPHHVLFSACKFFEVISKAITRYQKFNFRVWQMTNIFSLFKCSPHSAILVCAEYKWPTEGKRKKKKKAKSIFQDFSLKSTFKRINEGERSYPPWMMLIKVPFFRSFKDLLSNTSLMSPPKKKKQIKYWKSGLPTIYCKYMYDTTTKECCCVHREENSCNIFLVKRTALTLTPQFRVCLGAELGHISKACRAARLRVRKMNQP